MSTSIKAFAFAMIARRTPSMPIVYADAPGSINQSKKKKKKKKKESSGFDRRGYHAHRV